MLRNDPRERPLMLRRLVLRDLAWAGFILVVACVFGLLQHWPLVRISLEGNLRTHLEKLRTERRELKFQGVKTVSLFQAHDLLQQGQALFLDARPVEEYLELHIPQALNLTPEMLDKGEIQALPGVAHERQIVVYCGQVNCDAALKVAEKLQSLGYTQVAAFLAGFRAWDEAGYPVDTKK